MKERKFMLLEELHNLREPEEVKTFIIACSIKAQIQRLEESGINNKMPVGVMLPNYEEVLELLKSQYIDIKIINLVQIHGNARISYVIQLKTSNSLKERGMWAIVNKEQLKYIIKNYGIENKIKINKIKINKRDINQLLIFIFNRINQIL